MTHLLEPTYRQYADFFSMGILLELCSTNVVITWADQLITVSDPPSDWMIDISISVNKHPLDLKQILTIVPGKKDLNISIRLLIAQLSKVYPRLLSDQNRFLQPQQSRLLGQLYFLVREQDQLSDEVRGHISQLYCDLAYVEEGYGEWFIIQEDYNNLLDIGNPYTKWLNF